MLIGRFKCNCLLSSQERYFSKISIVTGRKILIPFTEKYQFIFLKKGILWNNWKSGFWKERPIRSYSQRNTLLFRNF
jgi:hypothetical protein